MLRTLQMPLVIGCLSEVVLLSTSKAYFDEKYEKLAIRWSNIIHKPTHFSSNN